MAENKHAEATIITIFGGSGDLTWRKLMPALFNLYLDNRLPEHFHIHGLGRQNYADTEYRKRLHEGVNKFSRRGKANPKIWEKFSSHISYCPADFAKPAFYTKLKKDIEAMEKEWEKPITRIFYLAIPPGIIEMISINLGKAGLVKDVLKNRVVVEKPFGHDLQSATTLNKKMLSIFKECQIYRIDHYLGKETVQNIMAFRFANALFEPLWNRNFIDHVQITVSEKIGVEDRGGYYETAGALRDMIQNHLLQLACLIAMEPPLSFAADEVRNKKVDVLNAVRPVTPQEVHNFAVRGQYGEGWIEGKKVKAYRDEKNVDAHSNTETFAAFKFFIDNWRWQNVPFYLRTGKRLQETISVITIQFRPVPHMAFPEESTENWQPNKLILNIQPDMGIRIRFQAKRPGLDMHLIPVDMLFDYSSTYTTGTPEAYETLLLDVMEGDATLFMRADQVEAAWRILMPVINTWAGNPSVNFPNYSAGMQGPEDAEALIARDGKSWIALPFDKKKK
ncbi:MAG: glucose-6-phosphate dehydrogenase [Chitinophagaceae bacterium]|nr:glucose-6-phosphate dehydrogenase [Bacteroidota bacterium]MCC6257128.1 glucose-6-phosphate dehydrogenase [Chitinophagaceae bacterium]MCW5916277.1 glucose-6-phosphate dehydrogenase [Ferruginibacter sp.]